MISLVSVGCLFWLERLQPLFLTVALGALVYELWLVSRRPPALRRPGTKTILTVSLMLNLVVIGGWIAIWVRYR
jgi:hypothetical protein